MLLHIRQDPFFSPGAPSLAWPLAPRLACPKSNLPKSKFPTTPHLTHQGRSALSTTALLQALGVLIVKRGTPGVSLGRVGGAGDALPETPSLHFLCHSHCSGACSLPSQGHPTLRTGWSCWLAALWEAGLSCTAPPEWKNWVQILVLPSTLQGRGPVTYLL